MTKRKSIIIRLALALVVLTLISFCFLGNTFARYTSSESGTATVSVAKWAVGISGNGVGETTLSFGKLSPAYEDGKTSNSTKPVLVATIVNNSEVDAKVTLTTSGETIALAGGSSDVTYTDTDVKDLFDITLYYSTSALSITDDYDITADSNATQVTSDITLNAIAVTETGSTISEIYVYAVVTWTTATSNGDELDTWAGENVTSVGYTLTYTAVQASKLP